VWHNKQAQGPEFKLYYHQKKKKKKKKEKENPPGKMKS
jgi:hypothetical protein